MTNDVNEITSVSRVNFKYKQHNRKSILIKLNCFIRVNTLSKHFQHSSFRVAITFVFKEGKLNLHKSLFFPFFKRIKAKDCQIKQN